MTIMKISSNYFQKSARAIVPAWNDWPASSGSDCIRSYFALPLTLLTMVRQIACLREERKFWPWVFRIAWSKLQDNQRRRRHQYSGKASFRWNQSYETRARSGNLLDATIHAERLQQLSEVVEQLSRQHRDILRLRYYEQLPYTEIAALTCTTPQKARARFHRAKKHLKARMQDDIQQGMSVVV